MEANRAEQPGSRVEARGWLEIVLAAVLSALFFALFLVLPIVGAIGLPLAAIPAVRLAHRRGAGAALLASALAGALLTGVGLAAQGASSWPRAAMASGVTALPALFASLAGRTGRPSGAFLGLCATGFALVLSVSLGGAALSGRPVGEEIAREFDRMAPAAIESYSRSGMDRDTMGQVRATLAAAREFSRNYWAGLLGLLWVFSSAISFYAGARSARPVPSADAARFEAFKAPAAVAPLFVAAGAGAVLLAPPAKLAAGSVLLPLFALYFVAGLSIICHFARKWFRVRILRVGLYTLVVAYFPINAGVALLGLFDWYVDFRRRGAGAIEKT